MQVLVQQLTREDVYMQAFGRQLLADVHQGDGKSRGASPATTPDQRSHLSRQAASERGIRDDKRTLQALQGGQSATQVHMRDQGELPRRQQTMCNRPRHTRSTSTCHEQSKWRRQQRSINSVK